MRMRILILAVASGAALLAAVALPASALPVPAPAWEGSVSAADLLARTASCRQVSNGAYRTDEGAPATVPVCGANGAVFFRADLDIDCDGQSTVHCNRSSDPWFLGDTAFHQSDGRPPAAESLPYVVVPGPSGIWDHAGAGIRGGGVAAVVHGDRVEYAVVGDTGPTGIIGEASYATAEALGIDPDPVSGGIGSGVTYLLFEDAQVSPIESHEAAVALGERLARQFLADN
ncbi:glycoside hydrolase family 75 protein [Streptomyces tropicalis]|uniref:Glycoside hydrolase family 75 protein n=1 Tax=Streptomyces tropicalis TaxID=3034234 RepID=A0ABT6A271_9ACTN|nr:glycoside hydrolase family 75 protein [Streptomyces tropicalis]MDF3298735.1 glycoside hydrolase family 75 protein [Streptomyces tropicalis]